MALEDADMFPILVSVSFFSFFFSISGRILKTKYKFIFFIIAIEGGAGTNSAILHYGHAASPNDKHIKDGEMCLFDMGANYCGYAADITCSFPVNGRFTEDQKIIYNAVLAARNAVCENAKEGVSWVDMHLLANRVMLEEMKKGNLLIGSVDEMIDAGLNAIFQPRKSSNM